MVNNEQSNLKNIHDYVTLSFSRVMLSDVNKDELIHFAAIRFRNHEATEFIDMYVENSKKKYDPSLNKKAHPFLHAISALRV